MRLGYERDLTVAEILATIPKVKALGLKRAVLDHGWRRQTGDWTLDPKKFPRSEAEMRALTDAVHAAGLKAALWIAPLAVAPGSDALHDSPDMLLHDKDVAVQKRDCAEQFYALQGAPRGVSRACAVPRVLGIVFAPLTNAGAPLITAAISLAVLGVMPSSLKFMGIALATVLKEQS